MMDPVQRRENSKEKLLAALCGHQADRERESADLTRRIVGASCGVMRAHAADCKRHRMKALIALLAALLLLGPLLGTAAYTYFEEELLAGQIGHLSVLLLFLLAALAIAVVLIGRLRNRP